MKKRLTWAAVIDGGATLIAPDPALAGGIVIGREEAVALARAAVERAVIEREPVSILTSGGPGARASPPARRAAANRLTQRAIRAGLGAGLDIRCLA